MTQLLYCLTKSKLNSYELQETCWKVFDRGIITVRFNDYECTKSNLSI